MWLINPVQIHIYIHILYAIYINCTYINICIVYIYTVIYWGGGRGRERQRERAYYAPYTMFGPENIAMNRLGQVPALSWKTRSINK